MLIDDVLIDGQKTENSGVIQVVADWIDRVFMIWPGMSSGLRLGVAAVRIEP